MRKTALVFVVALLASCGGKATFYQKADQALGTALTATNAARDVFVKWDESHQTALVEASATAEEAKTKVAAYRVKRANVQRAFTVAYSAIAAAAAGLAIAEKQGASLDLQALLVDAVKAALDVKRAVDAIRETPTPTKSPTPDPAPEAKPAPPDPPAAEAPPNAP